MTDLSNIAAPFIGRETQCHWQRSRTGTSKLRCASDLSTVTTVNCQLSKMGKPRLRTTNRSRKQFRCQQKSFHPERSEMCPFFPPVLYSPPQVVWPSSSSLAKKKFRAQLTVREANVTPTMDLASSVCTEPLSAAAPLAVNNFVCGIFILPLT